MEKSEQIKSLEKTIADSDIEKDICEIMKTLDKKVDTF